MLGEQERERCPVEDLRTWRDDFARLLNEGAGTTDCSAAHRIMNAINDPAYVYSADGSADMGRDTQAVLSRVAGCAEVLSAPIPLDEVVRALKALPNGKSRGAGRAPSECYKYARRFEVDAQGRTIAWCDALPCTRVACHDGAHSGYW